MNTEIKINSALQPQRSLLGFTQTLHQELKASNRHATAKAYLVAVNSLTAFTGNENLCLEDITAEQMQGHDTYLLNKGLTLNTASTYLRNLRAILNKAIKRGLILPLENNPFANVHTGIYKTQKRTMSVEEVQKLSDLQFPEKKPLSKARHHSLLTFLFCIHARGMSYKDVLFLKKTDINTDNNHIEYTRSKTKKDMNAYITPPMREIIDYFSTVTPEDSPYIFPIINPNKGDEYKQYQTAISLQNRHLKTLQKMAGILKTITTHVARHTWATLAKWENVPIALISECLGHRDIKTTEIYLASFDNPAKKKVSEWISALIFHPKEDGKTKSAKGSSKKSKSPYNEGINGI